MCSYLVVEERAEISLEFQQQELLQYNLVWKYDMSVIYVALPVALLISFAFVICFIWQVRSGQLDDLETPPRRILFDDVVKSSVARATVSKSENHDLDER